MDFCCPCTYLMVTSQPSFGYHWLGGPRRVLWILCGLRDQLLCTKTSLVPKTSSQHHMEKSSILIWFPRVTKAIAGRDPGGVLQAGNGQQCCLTTSHPCCSSTRGISEPTARSWLILHHSGVSRQPCSVRRNLMCPARPRCSYGHFGKNICPLCKND